MKKVRLAAGLAAAISTVAVVAFATAPAGAKPLATAAPAAPAATKCDAKIGFMGPFTGAAAPIGQEQLRWGQFGLKQWNAAHKTNIKFVLGDTQLNPAQATTVARKFSSDNSLVGILGPSGSQEVAAIAPIYTRKNLVYISPSATRTDLNKIKTFYRVVPTDADQGPTDANYLAKTLKVRSVYIIDDQSSYSTGLRDVVSASLKKSGVSVRTDSVTQDTGQDFSTLAGKIDTDAVFLPWQIAANAQSFAQALKAAGKGSVKIFGSDGLYSPGTFSAPGAYVSSFAPDIRGIAGNAALIKAYESRYGKKWGTFGPPVYVAAQVLAAAATKACAAGKLDRKTMLANVGKTNMAKSILGSPISFNSSRGLKNAKFYIFKIANDGTYKLQK